MGSTAINDSFLLESCIYLLIKKRFGDRPLHAKANDLFREVRARCGPSGTHVGGTAP